MKKIFFCLMIIALVFTGCAVEKNKKEKGEDIMVEKSSILFDKNYTNGFHVSGLITITDGNAVKAVFDYDIDGQKPQWRIAQWSSRYSFADPTHTKIQKISNNEFIYKNTTKTFGVNTESSELIFGVTASECYDSPRQYGEGWAHLLIEQSLTDHYNPSIKNKVDNMRKLIVKMKAKLTKFEDKMDGKADESLHAAQFQLFLYLTNLNLKSKGRNDKIWFGIPLFDNRYEITAQYGAEDVGQAGASHQYIYTIGGDALYSKDNNFWRDGKIYASDESGWIIVEIDVLPYVKKALGQAHERGFMLESELEDLFISGLNLGWEVPGTYDVEMRIKDFDIICEYVAEDIKPDFRSKKE